MYPHSEICKKSIGTPTKCVRPFVHLLLPSIRPSIRPYIRRAVLQCVARSPDHSSQSYPLCLQHLQIDWLAYQLRTLVRCYKSDVFIFAVLHVYSVKNHAYMHKGLQRVSTHQFHQECHNQWSPIVLTTLGPRRFANAFSARASKHH